MGIARLSLCIFVLSIPLHLPHTLDVYGEEDKKPTLLAAYTTKSLNDPDTKDIKAALTSWIRESAEREGFQIETHAYENAESLLKDFSAGRLDIVIIQSLDYFSAYKKIGQETVVLKARQGQIHERYILLINSIINPKDLKYLRSKRLSIAKRSDLGMAFMDTLLLKARLPEAKRFFSEIQENGKESQAILAVFFGQADVCITTEMAFKTAVELNPQVGNKLQIIATSPDLVETISLFSANVNNRYRERVINGMINLPSHPRGKQALLLFNADKTAVVTKENLETTKVFIENYHALKGR